MVVADADKLRARLARFIAIMVAAVLAGTVGFVILEGWSVVDALYMTVITISTVGFGEVRPLSEGGQLFTIGLILAGVSNGAYLFSTLGEYVVGGQLSGSLRSRRMRQNIAHLDNHYIICGFGRVGEQVARDLEHAGADFVVVEPDEDALERVPEGYLTVHGDAAADEKLEEAGIRRAAGLVAATGDDARNIFITLSARNINSELEIVARANDPATETKLVRAGASHVISPYIISGRRIATQLLNPSVTKFIDGVMPSGSMDMWMEEVPIGGNSDLVGRSLGASNIGRETGAFVIAVRRAENVVSNPSAELVLDKGDVLLALGSRSQIGKLADLAAAPSSKTTQHSVWY